MGLWDFLTQSMGLLGKLIFIKNADRRFGSADEYVVIQVEHDGSDERFSEGEEEVLLFTPHQLEQARFRAAKNPEDIEAFLKDHAIQDSVD